METQRGYVLNDKRSRMKLYLVIVAIVVVGGISGYLIWHHSRAAKPPVAKSKSSINSNAHPVSTKTYSNGTKQSTITTYSNGTAKVTTTNTTTSNAPKPVTVSAGSK